MLLCVSPPFLHGTKLTSRFPPQREMSLVVRAAYRLQPNEPLVPIDDPHDRGALSGDAFSEGDDERTGALTRASDFADLKLKADLLLRGTCYPGGGRSARELTATFRVGSWSKAVRVSGPRVWTEVPGNPISAPAPFVSMPLTYQNAFGGPTYPRNPVGMGIDTPELPRLEDPKAPIQSRSDRPSPAGFGPISPNWPERICKLGTQYGKEWKKTRAPFYAADFDWSYFNAAPVDQQLASYLRGDEELAFDYLHREEAHFTTRLPGVRACAFVRHVDGTTREVPMNLDTLVVDLDAERLELSWRGLTPVADDDFEDVRTLYVACEPLGTVRSLPQYAALLDDLERNPEKYLLSAAVQAQRDAALAKADELEAMAAGLRAKGEEGLAKARQHARGHVGRDPMEAMRSATRAQVKDAPASTQANVEAALVAVDKEIQRPQLSPLTSPARLLAASEVLAGARAVAEAHGAATAPFDETEASLVKAREAQASMARSLRAGAARPGMNPRVAAVMSSIAARAEQGQMDGPPPDWNAPMEPGPRADLVGRDLTGADLHGRDLTEVQLAKAKLVRANLRGAKLVGANLADADMSDADLTGADLTKALLTGACLRSAKLDGALLTSAALGKADLTRASLVGARGERFIFGEATLVLAILRGARFSQVLFDRAVLDGADFRDAVLDGCMFQQAYLRRARFDRARLAKTSFMRCDASESSFWESTGDRCAWMGSTLTKANASHARWSDANFMKATLDDAVFFGARLCRGRFEHATAARTSFERADLLRANFSKAILSATRFVGANLYDARFFGAAATAECDFARANLKRALWELP